MTANTICEKSERLVRVIRIFPHRLAVIRELEVVL